MKYLHHLQAIGIGTFNGNSINDVNVIFVIYFHKVLFHLISTAIVIDTTTGGVSTNSC